MIDDIKQDAGGRMGKSIAAYRDDLAKVRTGRAHTSLLDHVTVAYYGSEVPLAQAANIAVADSRTLTVTPWDKSLVPTVEKAIMSADMGLNPVTAGNVIRVPLPPLTEERRRELVRVVRNEAEKTRVAIRNIRRDALGDLKTLLKEKEISEDDERRAQDDVQKLTDRFIADADAILADKEAELLEV